ncbi:MAG: hypothetical protein RIS26_1196, partial [Actinomycetota bacterium]
KDRQNTTGGSAPSTFVQCAPRQWFVEELLAAVAAAAVAAI